MRSKVLIIVAGAALGSACETTPVDPGLGEALKYDMAIQTIDPDPTYSENATKPGSLGTAAAAAAARYRTGGVKAVERIDTGGSSGPK